MSLPSTTAGRRDDPVDDLADDRGTMHVSAPQIYHFRLFRNRAGTKVVKPLERTLEQSIGYPRQDAANGRHRGVLEDAITRAFEASTIASPSMPAREAGRTMFPRFPCLSSRPLCHPSFASRFIGLYADQIEETRTIKRADLVAEQQRSYLSRQLH
ncbi:hypothetical protein MMC32_001631 [Xylographa parallela]|nr:hypothetical protein [Xylographa parallela]